MGNEAGFEREVLDRLIKIETILTACPDCQRKVITHEEQIKGIYRTAAIAGGGVSILVQVGGMMLQKAFGH